MSAIVAVLVVGALTIQSLGSAVVPLARQSGTAIASAPGISAGAIAIRGLAAGPQPGQLVLSTRPFAVGSARRLAGLLGMDLVSSFSAFGLFVLALPRIEVTPLDAQHAVVLFPPQLTIADRWRYLADNRLTVDRWSRDRESGDRVAFVSLPRIQFQPVDAGRGLWQAGLAPNLDPGRLSDWVAVNGAHLVSYDPATGAVVIQRPVPAAAPPPVRYTPRPAARPAPAPAPAPPPAKPPVASPPASSAPPPTAPAPPRFAAGFAASTTAAQASAAVTAAGGTLVSFDGTGETGVVEVAADRQAAVTTVLSGTPGVACISASLTACTPSPPAALAAPTGLAAAPGTARLTWSHAPGAAAYAVWRSSSAGGPWALVGRLADLAGQQPAFADAAPPAGTAFYTVTPLRACPAAGGSDCDGPAPAFDAALAAGSVTVATATTPAAPRPVAPVIQAAEPGPGTLSGTVVLRATVRGDAGGGTATWSAAGPRGVVGIGSAASTPSANDPRTWSATLSWDTSLLPDGAYVLRATASSRSGATSSFDTSVTVLNAAPAAPTGLGAQALAGGGVALTWQQPPAADGAVTLVRRDSSPQPVAELPAGTLSWIDAGAGPGTHQYRVSLLSRSGRESAAATVSATSRSGGAPVATPRPSLRLPGGRALATDGQVQDRLLLAEDPAAGQGVTFQFAPDAATSWTAVAAGVVCTPGCAADWGLAGLAAGHYRVEAVSAGGQTSAPAGFTIRAADASAALLPAPEAPVAALAPGGVALSWTSGPDALAGQFLVSRLEASGWQALAHVAGGSFLDTTAPAGATAAYRVQAFDGDGVAGIPSAQVTIDVPAGAAGAAAGAAAPRDVRAVAGIGTTVVLWSPVAGAQAYQVERAWGIDAPFAPIGLTGAAIFRDDVAVGGQALYRVRALAGSASTPVEAVVIPTPAQGVPTAFVLATGGGPSAPAGPSLDLGAASSSAAAGTRLAVTAAGQAAAPVVEADVQLQGQGVWHTVAVLPVRFAAGSWEAAGDVLTAQVAEGAYRVRVVALAADGSVAGTTAESDLSVVHSAPAVVGLAATVGASVVRLRWTPAGAGLTYRVYRLDPVTSEFALAADGLTDATFDDAWLTPGGQTGYVVTAVDRFGNEGPMRAPVWTATPAPAPAPVVTFLTPAAAELPGLPLVELAVQATAPRGLASVLLAFAPAGGGAWTSVQPLPLSPQQGLPDGSLQALAGAPIWAASLSTANLPAGRYGVRVTVTDRAGLTSQVVDGLTVGAADARGPPAEGFHLSASALADGGLHLTWRGAAGTSFQVRRAAGASGLFSSLGTVTGTAFDDLDALPGLTYDYQVVRLDPGLAFSDVLTATAPAGPGGDVASPDGNLSVHIPGSSAARLAVAAGRSQTSPRLDPGLAALGSIYEVDARSLATGAPVHQLDQPATLVFALPPGLTAAQAAAIAVYHWDEGSLSWVREPSVLDLANHRITATVTHFSLFTAAAGPSGITVTGTSSVTVTDTTSGDTLGVSPDPANPTTGIQVTSASSPTVTFAIPTVALTILATAGQDTVNVSGSLKLPGVAFEVDATTIGVSGATLDTTPGTNGSITLKASDTGGRTRPTTNASVTISGATLESAAIDLEAASTQTVTPLPLPAPADSVNLSSTATVAVAGASTLTSSGAVTLASTSSVTSSISTAALAGVAGSDSDAVAVSVVSSTATTHVSDASSIGASGAVKVTASNTTQVTTAGDATPAISGGGFSTSNVTANTSAFIDSSSTAGVKAATLTVAADAKNTVGSTARVSAGGVQKPTATPATDPNALTQGRAQTSDGSVAIAGAVAFTDLTSSTLAFIAPVTTGAFPVTAGTVIVHASTTNASSATADGSPNLLGAIGVGVAVAVDLANVTTRATVANAQFTAGQLTVEAVAPLAPAVSGSYAATSTSGGGAAPRLGVAGSIAENLVSLDTEALLPDNQAISTTGNVTLTATSGSAHAAHALPAASGPPGTEFGAGTSYALDAVTDLTSASLGNGSTLSGAKALTLAATTRDAMDTDAEMGATPAATGTPPPARLTRSGSRAISNVTTTAGLGAGSAPLTLSGALAVGATQTATVTTKAGGSPNATAAALGLALALTDTDHVVRATTARGLTAAAVSFTATQTSSTTGTANGGAKGAPGAGSAAAPAGGVNGLVAAERGFADTQAGTTTAATPTPSAQTSAGKLTVAAAVVENVVSTSALAALLGPVAISTAGAFTLKSLANTGAKATADGSGASGSAVGIGAAVAIDLVDMANQANVPAGASVAAKSLDVEAVMNPVPPTACLPGLATCHVVSAEADAGGGADTLSVAGSLAIDVVNLTTLASLTGSASLAGGDATLAATSLASSSAKAEPAGATTNANFGFGAAAALNLFTDTTTASLDDGALLSGANNLQVQATTNDTLLTDAKMGDTGGSVAVTPAAAVSYATVATKAAVGAIGGSPPPVLTLAGGATVVATQATGVTTTAGAAASNASAAAVGVALALTVANESVAASLARSLTAGGAVTVAATGSSGSLGTATGSTAGAPAAGSTGAPASVNAQVTAERSNADGEAAASGGSGSGSTGTPSAQTSGGPVTVASAVAVTMAGTSSLAQLVGAVTVRSGGALTLQSTANTHSSANADASPSNGGGTAIGAGVAVDLAAVQNQAQAPGGSSLFANAVNVTAGMTTFPGTGDQTHAFSAVAVSGAGGGLIPTVGALAIDLVSLTTLAQVRSAQVTLTGGDLTLSATSIASSTASAQPTVAITGTGLKVGAPFALNVVDETVNASLAPGTAVNGARNILITIVSSHAKTTEARIGVTNNVVAGPPLAITISNLDAVATTGTGPDLVLSGSLTLSISKQPVIKTTAASVPGGFPPGVGVALALTFAHHTVSALIERNVSAGGAITLVASGASGTTTQANATVPGAPGLHQPGAPANGIDGLVAQERTAADALAAANVGAGSGQVVVPSAATSAGPVLVAAAVAVNVATTSSRATLVGPVTVSAGGALSLLASANTHASAVADASTTIGGSTNVGAAVAINLATVTNQATIPAGTTVSARSLDVDAAMTSAFGGDQTHTFNAEADAGTGGGALSVAGALALDVVDLTTQALVSSGSVTLTGGDANLVAASVSSSTAKAEPVGKSTGGAGSAGFGLGASVALNLVSETTTAALDDGAVLTGAANLNLTATTTNAMVTEAKMGDTGGSVDVTPAVAVSVSNITTAATVGTGALLTLTAGLSAKATQQPVTVKTTAGATASNAASAGFGVALALTVVDHAVSATTARSLSAAGAVSFLAFGASTSESHANASAGGAPATGAATAPAGGVDGQVKKERDFADQVVVQAGGKPSGTTATPSAQTSAGKVAVAAAIAVDVATTSSLATLLGPVTIGTQGALTLNASANTHTTAQADGSATRASSVGVGAGVAIDLASIGNQATIPAGTVVSAKSLDVEAVTTDLLGNTTHTTDAEAASGAGNGALSVAGSLALNLVDLVTTAAIASGSVTLAGGDARVVATATSSHTAKAEPVGAGTTASGAGFGFGAAVALNLVTDTATASLDDNAVLTGAGNLTLTPTTTDAMVTEAKNGDTGGSVAITPAVAVAVSDVTTAATAGVGTALTLAAGLNATAKQTASATTTAASTASQAKAAVTGVSLALTVANHAVTATAARALAAGAAVSLTATGASTTATAATASASGAPPKATPGAPAAGVDGQAKLERDFADLVAAASGLKGSGPVVTPSAQTADGKLGVAGAVAIDLATTASRAALLGGVAVTAAGALTIKASAGTQAKAVADGTQAHDSSLGVGVAAAVDDASVVNQATTGASNVAANGVDVEATMTSTVAAGTTSASHAFDAEAKSGAGSAQLDVAGALALNIVSDDTEATIPAGAAIAAGTGGLTLQAANVRSDTAKAVADDKLGSVGAGASLAVNVLTPNITRAEVGAGVPVTFAAPLKAANSVTIGATSSDVPAPGSKTFTGVTTSATAGTVAGTAVSPAVAITVATDDTTASLDAGPALAAGGPVSITATHSETAVTSGDALAAGASVAVGAVVAFGNVTDTTTATTGRSLSALSLTVGATSTVQGDSEATASAVGEGAGGKTADHQVSDQVNNNPLLKAVVKAVPLAGAAVRAADAIAALRSGKAVSHGDGVAASVSFDLLTDLDTASVAGGLTVTTVGAVSVTAPDQANATARAIGGSGDLKATSNVGAGVGFNVADVESTASIGVGATVTAGSVTVASATPAGKENDFTAWGIGAAGGRTQASVAAGLGVQTLTLHTMASIGRGSRVTATGGVVLNAVAPAGLQDIALAGGVSLGGTAVGGALAVDTLDLQTVALVDSDTTAAGTTSVDASGAISLDARSKLGQVPITVPNVPKVLIPSLTAVAVGGDLGTGSDAVTGSIVVDLLGLATRAQIADGARVNQVTATPGGLLLAAQDDTSVAELAGAFAGELADVGVGLGLVVDVVSKDVRASIGKAVRATAGGDVNLQAGSTESFVARAVDAVVATATSLTGSVIVLALDDGAGAPGTRAYVDGGAGAGTTLHAAGSVSLSAIDTATSLDLRAGTVDAGLGASVGFGAAAVTLVRDGAVEAFVGQGDDVQAKGATGLSLRADQRANVTLMALGGTGGATAGVAGSAVVDLVTDATTAHVDQGVVLNGDNTGAAATEGLALAASDLTTVFGSAGALALGGAAGIGAGVDVETIAKDTEARVASGFAATVNGDATVDATSSERITSLAVGAGFGGTAAVTVSAVVPVLTVTTKAFVDGGPNLTDGAVVNAGGSARIAADEQLALDVIAGNVSGSGAVAVGPAAVVPVVTKTTAAFLGDHATLNAKGNGGAGLTVHTGAFDVTLTDTRFAPSRPGVVEADGLTLNLGFAHGLGEGEQVRYDDGGGADIGGLIGGAVYFVHVVSPTEVQLSATPGGAPIALTPPAAGGESQRLVPTDRAGVPQDRSPRFDPAADVSGDAITLPYALSVSTGDPVVYTAGGGAPIGGLSDGATYYAIVLGPSLELAASRADALAGTQVHLDATQATGRSHSLVKQGALPSADAAEALGSRAVAARTGTGFRGVSITATNSDDVAGVAASAAIAGSTSVGVSGGVLVIDASTAAHIGKFAQVNVANAGASAAQTVQVAAGDVLHLLLVAAGAGVGTAAGAGADATAGLVTLATDAFIDASSTVAAAADVLLTADGRDTVVSVAAGGGAGAVGVAGAVSVVQLAVHTFADTGSGVTISAGDNVLVAAHNDTNVQAVAGALSAGAVGVGAGVAVTTIAKDTEAFVGAGSTVDARATQGGALVGVADGTIAGTGFGALAAFHGLAVQAASTERLLGVAASGTAGFVGVAGGLGVALIHVVTKAFVDAGSAVDTLGGAAAQQSVNVSATDALRALTVAGGAAGGAVGIAGGVDVGVADATTKAFLGAGSTVDAMGGVDVNALSIKQVQSYAFSIGAGLTGLAGSVSVWTLGTTTDSTFHDGASGNDRGTWRAGATYNKGDVVTGSDGLRYGARVEHPTDDPTARTGQWQGATDALRSGAGSAAADAGTQAAGAGGYLGILNGTSAGSTDPVDQRIRAAAGTTSAAVAAGAPGAGAVSAALADPTLPEGTVAQLAAASVTAGGSVHVRATESLGHRGLAGTAAGGLVAIGGAVVIANVRGLADASIASGAAVSAAGDVAVLATTNESADGLAFAGQAGLVAVGAQVVRISDASGQNAHVDDGASIRQAGGTIDVEAAGNRFDRATDGAVTVGVAGAAGAAVAIASVSGDTTASVGDVAIGQAGPVGALKVAASSTIAVPTSAISVVGGIGLALGAAVAAGAVTGTTGATSNAHGPVAGAVSVTADSAATLTASTLDVAAAVAGGGLAIASTVGGRATSATVGFLGDVTAGTTVTVRANALDHATSSTVGGTAGVATVDVLLPKAIVSGSTTAELDGQVRGSTGVAVQALADNQVSADAEIANVSVAGLSGGFSDAEITGPAITRAIVEGNLTSSGPVLVDAEAVGARNSATAIANAITFGAILAGSSLRTRANVSGAVIAEVDGSVAGSSRVDVQSSSANSALARTLAVTAGVFAGAGSGARSDVTSVALTSALVGSTSSIASAGLVHLQATSANDAEAYSELGVGGVGVFAAATPVAQVAGPTQATFGGSIPAAGGLTVQATSQNFAEANSFVVAVGAITAAGAAADAEITSLAFTQAAVGSGTLALTGAVQVVAASADLADAMPAGANFSLVGIFFLRMTARIGDGTSATFGGSLTSGTGLSVVATGQHVATADADVRNVSLVAGGTGAVADAEVLGSANVNATIVPGATVAVSGPVLVSAALTPDSAGRQSFAQARAHTTAFGVIAAGVMSATALVGGPVNAELDGVVSQSTSVTVTATGVNDAEALSSLLGVNVIGISAGTTLARVQSTAGVNALVSSFGAVTTTGAVAVTANATDTARATSDVKTVGAIVIDVAAPARTAATPGTDGGQVAADVLGGASAGYSGSLAAASSLTVQATGGNTALATSAVRSVGLLLAGFGAGAETTVGGATQAKIGAGAGVHVTGQVQVAAGDANDAESRATGEGGGLVDVAIMLTTVNMVGVTRAFIDDGAVVTAGSVNVSASATNLASGTADQFGIDAVGFSGISSNAADTATVEAFIGPVSGTAAANPASPTHVTATGAGGVQVTATLVATTTATTSALSIGLLGGGAFTSTVTTDLQHVRAYLGDHAVVDRGPGPTGLVATATIAETASGSGLSAALGFAGEGASVFAPLLTAVAAFTAGGGTLGGSAVTLGASLGGAGAAASLTLGSFALVAGATGGDASALATPTVDAHIGPGTVVDSAGAVGVTATSATTATAHADGTGAGLVVGIGQARATATASSTTTASLDGSVAHGAGPGATDLSIVATAGDFATATADAASGGLLFAGQDNESEADVQPVTRAFIDAGAAANVSGNLKVDATERPEGDAATHGTSIGGIQVGSSESKIVITPTVDAHVAGSPVLVGGSVEVLADGEPLNAIGGPTFQIVNVDPATAALEVDNHGLALGDVVEYHSPAGNLLIGGLVTTFVDNSLGDAVTAQRQYSALPIDANHLALGEQFDGASGVDPNTETITFSSPHNLRTGDAVVYQPAPGTAGTVGGLTPGVTYFVVALDDRRIRLTATLDQALNPQHSIEVFNPSAVGADGTTITIAGHGFGNGQAVTYHAPQPQSFGSSQVNVTPAAAGTQPNDSPAAADILFFDAQGSPIAAPWATGQTVVYHAASSGGGPATPIGGLVDGGLYRVVRTSAGSVVQLKYNDVVTAAVSFARAAAGDQVVRGDGASWAANGFGAGQQLVVRGTAADDGTYTIAGVSGATLTLTAANTVTAETDAAATFDEPVVPLQPVADGVTTVATFSGSQITRTDGQGWGDTTFVPGAQVNVTAQDAADDAVTGTYTIQSVSGSTLTVAEALPSFTAIGVTIQHPVTAGITTQVTFAAATTGDTLTRTDGASWGPGFGVGTAIQVTGSAANNGGYTIAAVSGATLVLTVSGRLQAETSTPNVADAHDPGADVHTLLSPADAAIGGLVDGHTYFVINATASTFQLAASATSTTPIALGTAGLTGTHSFSPTLALQPAAAPGGQQLRIAITGRTTADPSAGAPDAGAGPQTLTGPNGSPLSLATALPAGHGFSSADSRGSGGGFVGVGHNHADVTDSPSVSAAVTGALLRAGGNVTVGSTASAIARATSKNGTGGFVAIGKAETAVEEDVSSLASVGAGSQVLAGGSFALQAASLDLAQANTRAFGGGFVGVAGASTTVNLNYQTEATIGANAVVVAAGSLQVTATPQVSGLVFSKGDGAGFGADGRSTANGSSTGTSLVDVGAGASLTGDSVVLAALVGPASWQLRSQSFGAGFFSEAVDRATLLVTATNSVLVHAGASVTSTHGMDIRVRYDAVNTFADSFARVTGLFGYVSARATNQTSLTSVLTTEAGSHLTAGGLTVDVANGSVSTDAHGHVSRRAIAAGGAHDNSGQTLTTTRTVTEDGDVTILPPP